MKLFYISKGVLGTGKLLGIICIGIEPRLTKGTATCLFITNMFLRDDFETQIFIQILAKVCGAPCFVMRKSIKKRHPIYKIRFSLNQVLLNNFANKITSRED